jgi:hypothetical protein
VRSSGGNQQRGQQHQAAHQVRHVRRLLSIAFKTVDSLQPVFHERLQQPSRFDRPAVIARSTTAKVARG